MKIPKIYIKNNKKYYYVETCENFIRYKTKEGISECFNLHDLGILQQVIKPPRKAYKGGSIIIR